MWPLPYFFLDTAVSVSPTPVTPGYVSYTSLLDSLLRQSRDADAAGICREDALRMLAEALQVIGCEKELDVQEATITVTEGTYFVNPNASVTDFYKAIELRHEGRDLPHTPFHVLNKLNPKLLDERANAPRCWSRLGWNRLLIWPAPHNSYSITMRYAPLYTDLEEADTSNIREEDAPLILAMALRLVRLRFRDIPGDRNGR